MREARREVSVGGYRADLVVVFADDDWAHVEVKVGDLSLTKTPATGDALRRRIAGASRGDFLLLPPDDVAVWEADRLPLGESGARVQVFTWTDLARALRQSVAEPDSESVIWRVWAVTYLGAIEQLLLDFPPVPPADGSQAMRPSSRDLARLEFLEALEARRS